MEECIIDLSNQNQIDADELMHELKKLRSMVMDLAVASKDAPYKLEEFCSNLYVLNWLIEDVTFIDKKHKRQSEAQETDADKLNP